MEIKDAYIISNYYVIYYYIMKKKIHVRTDFTFFHIPSAQLKNNA